MGVHLKAPLLPRRLLRGAFYPCKRHPIYPSYPVKETPFTPRPLKGASYPCKRHPIYNIAMRFDGGGGLYLGPQHGENCSPFGWVYVLVLHWENYVTFPFKLNGIWSWWQFSFRFLTKLNSIWLKKSIGKLSSRWDPIQCERNLKYCFLSVGHVGTFLGPPTHVSQTYILPDFLCIAQWTTAYMKIMFKNGVSALKRPLL